MDIDERIKRLKDFNANLLAYDDSYDPNLREWLNQNVAIIQREVIEAGCHVTVTISPPPAVGGLVMQGVEPFAMMFERPYSMSLTHTICDMIDKTIGVLKIPPPPKQPRPAAIEASIQTGYAFVAMEMDNNDPLLIDVFDAIKEGAAKCKISAERIDDVESNDRVTDRILESIRKAEFVIVDLTNERPNVFFEAGYAHGIGKTPIYVARAETKIHFDIKDYPIIFFRNMKELKDGVAKRLVALARKRAS